MSRPVYSTRFIAGGVTSVDPLVFTCPEGYRTVLRDLDAVGPVGEYVQLANETAGVSIFYSTIEGAGGYGWLGWRGRQVCNPGDVIELITGTSETVTVSLSGYLLTLP